MNKNGKIRPSIVIDYEDWRELKTIAIKKDSSASRIIRGLVREYLKKENNKSGESF